jgi:phosphate ABC transporter phosphate-binding protein
VAPSTVRRVLRARVLAAAAAVLTAVFAGALVPAQSASAASFVTINGAGSTWAANAIGNWVGDVVPNGLTVNYAGIGSAAARQDFAQGVVNFAASEIPYGVPDGGASNPAPSRGYAYVPDVAGGVALTYNLVIGGQQVTNLRLSGAVIAGIFTNQITMWDDPMIAADNPGLTLPATPITPVARTDSSGANWAFTQWMIATQDSSWTSYCQAVGLTSCVATTSYPVQPGTAMVGMTGDTGVSGYVSQFSSDGAIGVTEYAYAVEAALPVADVLNAAGYYSPPTPQNVGLSLLKAQVNSDGTENLSQVYADSDPRAYELSYYSYMIVPTASSATYPLTTAQGFSLGTFGSFALCQGQQQVDNLGYAALPVNLVEDGYQQLQEIPGAQVPATTSEFIEGCNNPTFSPDGTNKLAEDDPMPPACDQQGPTQCASATSGAVETTTTVTASPNPVAAGQTATLTATVAPVAGAATPAGSVVFEVGGTTIRTPVPLNSSGVARTTETFIMAGTQVVSAVFAPNDSAAFSTSTGTVSVLVTPTSNIGITVETTVAPTGTFTFTAPANATIALTVSGDTATGALIPVAVSDTRNTYPGWSVVGQATAFTDPTSNPAGDIPGNQLGWVPTSTSLSDGADLGGPVLPATPGLGSIAGVLAVASPGDGFGTSTLGANLTLAIPPAAPSGAYSGELTLTAEPAGP